jgi:uncharacterized protein (TIGR02001 family)
VLRYAFVPLALLAAGLACAQTTGSVSVLSDYRYRGASLSDARPALQVQFGRDFDHGGYAGLQVSTVWLEERAGDGLQVLPYAGVVRPLPRGWHWEAGVQYAAFLRSGEYDYAEAFAGIGTDRAGVRIFYSNDYFGQWPAWYATFDGNHDLSPRWRLLGHVGVLRSMGGEVEYRRDWTAGIGLGLRDCELQLTWGGVDADARAIHRPPGYRDEGGWMLRLRRGW